MWEYLKRHERFIKQLLEQGDAAALDGIREYHEKQLRYLQHERLVHLLVTLFVALFLLLSVGYGVLQPTLVVGVLATLLLVLTAAYLVHYYRLENGVQRLYNLSIRLDERLAGRRLRPDDAKDPPA